MRGNTDPGRIEHVITSSQRFHSLDRQRHQFYGFQILGVSGTLPIPFRSRIGWFERRRLDRLAALIDSHSILVAHPPSWGGGIGSSVVGMPEAADCGVWSQRFPRRS